MRPVEFEQHNIIFTLKDDPSGDLPAYIHDSEGDPAHEGERLAFAITKWMPSYEDIQAFFTWRWSLSYSA